jgi:hypothetical protein
MCGVLWFKIVRLFTSAATRNGLFKQALNGKTVDKNQLCISLSASVDLTDLIQSGRGNWPDETTATG